MKSYSLLLMILTFYKLRLYFEILLLQLVILKISFLIGFYASRIK